MAEKNYYSSKESTGKTKAIIIVLWILLVAVIITGAVFIWKNVSDINADNTIEKNTAVQTAVQKNVLLCIEDNDNKNITPQFLLLGFDGQKGNINILELPDTLKITASDKSDTMLNLYNYGGLKYLSEAVANNYTISIDSYIGCSMAEVETLVDKLGGIDYNIEEKMLQKNNEGNLITNLVKGSQKLNGNQVCQYIRYDGWSGKDQKAIKRADLAKAFFNEYAPFIDSDTMISLYNSVSNKLNTNVSIIKMNDFSKQFKAFQKSENVAVRIDIPYSSQSYNDVKIRNIFEYK